jgi:hypothetical protein
METVEMKRLTLKRIATGDKGTFGVLIFNGIPFAVTLEPEWADNQKNISCIPAGEYLCEEHNSPHFGFTYQITNVPDRTHILFHKGNFTHNTKGCVLVGEQFQNDCIMASQAGYRELMFQMRGLPAFMLEIKECY